MKTRYIIAIMVLVTACQPGNRGADPESKAQSFFVGTYTDGESLGIYTFEILEDGNLRQKGPVAASENPSFLTRSAGGRFLLAVNEVDRNGTGSVQSFRISGDSLVFISRSSSGGAHPCFITANDAGYLLVANYTGGNVGLLKMNDNGRLSALLDLQQHNGRGTTDRQEGPHAHSACFVPGSNLIIAADLGTNELWFSWLDTTEQKLAPASPPTLPMAPGAGPRHLAFHPGGRWIYVVNELDCTITQVIADKSGAFVTGPSISTLPENYPDPNTCADIHITSDGKFLYASNRGHNSLAIFRVDASTGNLHLTGHEYTRGDTPRNFALTPDEKFMVVANQDSHTLVSFRRDAGTGKLTYISEVQAHSPVCILF